MVAPLRRHWQTAAYPRGAAVLVINSSPDVVGADVPAPSAHHAHLGSRLRRRQTTSFEFAHAACLDSIAYLPGGRDRSAHIPDHEHFRRDRPHLAGDGPRPVR